MEYMRIIAVDFDGTLVENRWPDIGPARADILQAALKAQSEGAKIILWTCRDGKLLDDAVEWCRSVGLALDAINDNIPEVVSHYGKRNPRKVTATEYWDDRAIKC